MTAKPPLIEIRPMCNKHRKQLMEETDHGPNDPWQILEIAASISLFQAATCDPKTHEFIGDDITAISELGCLGCYRPEVLNEIIEAGKTRDIKQVKAVGEKYLAASGATMTPVNLDKENMI